MASYSTSQAGNFSSSSTWGGNTPGNGDILTINHNVVFNITSPPSTGYGNVTVSSGAIFSNTSGSTLRMNGTLTANGGTIHFKDSMTVQFNGGTGDDHGLEVEGAANSNLILEGDDPSGITTTTSAKDGDDSSFGVASTTSLNIGDWVQIYSVDYTSDSTELDGRRIDDEGFWIHDISGSTIYTRDFVGPEDVTLTGIRNSTTITVSNAKVFREGGRIIFGTGSNRTITTITSIVPESNTLFLSSSVTGEPSTGDTKIYRSSSLKPHPSGSKVRKRAGLITAESASGSSNITVNGPWALVNGDRIWIEKKSEAANSTDYADQNTGYDYTVQTVNGSTVTVAPALNYRVAAGSIFSKLNRSLVMETLATDGSDYAHLYVKYDSADWARYIILKDVEFKNWGNNDTNTRTGVTVRGMNKINDSSIPVTLNNTIPVQHRGTWIEGLTVTHYPGHERDWGSIWLYDCRSTVARSCTTLYGDDGIALHHEPYQSMMGCITAGQRSFGNRAEGTTDMYEISYNYSSRNNNRARIYGHEEGLGGNMHNCIIDATDYASTGFYNAHPGEIWRCKFTGLRYGVISETSSEQKAGFLDCFIQNLSGVGGSGTSQSGQYRQAHYNRGGSSAAIMSLEHNFEEAAINLYGYNWEASWDATEDAWHFIRRYDSDDNPSIGETVYVPANTELRVSAQVKGVSGFSGSRPSLFAVDTRSLIQENCLGFTATTNRPLRGKRYNEAYTSAMDSGYEEKQITVSAEPFSRFMKVGVRSSNRNAQEGFYIKNVNAFLSKGMLNKMFQMGQAGSANPITYTTVRSTFTVPKTRLGGRIK
jgi:hypothetical protein